MMGRIREELTPIMLEKASSCASLFVATHSADFVMGAIQSGATVNIVRLTWANDAATARLLPSPDLVTLMNDPMLRSVGVLSGLFYQNVVVLSGSQPAPACGPRHARDPTCLVPERGQPSD